MKVLTVSDELAKEIESEAQTRGHGVEELLKQAIRRERTLAERKKIEREQTWWLAQPLTERAKYSGKYIAVHNQALVDSDVDSNALYRRVRARFGRTPVLMMPAEGPREIRIYSTRMVRDENSISSLQRGQQQDQSARA